MGCFCEGGKEKNLAFGEECVAFNRSNPNELDYHEGFFRDLEDVVGFASSADELTWTVSHEGSGLCILLCFSFLFILITLLSISRKA